MNEQAQGNAPQFDLSAVAEPTQEVETLQEVPMFWQEQVQYIKDYTVFMTICFGILVGLLCALLIKRG